MRCLKHAARASLLASLLLAIVSFAPTRALAQWRPGGVPVCADCSGTSEDVFRAIPDGEGGVFVAWRRSLAIGSDLYLQRLTRDGYRAPGWPPGGVPLVVAPEQQDIEDLVSDGSGGVFAFWSDYRDINTTYQDVYASHVLANGTLAPGWPVNGRVVSNAISSQGGPRGCADGQGGVIVAWTDYRNGNFNANTNPDVYAVRLLADGSVAPGWAAGGVPLAADPAVDEFGAFVVSDGAGGAYLAFMVGIFWPDIRVLRVHGTGAVDPQWPVGGVVATKLQRSILPDDACSDGSGGLFIAWSDLRSYAGFPPSFPYNDVYATYLQPDGSFASGWGVNGRPIAAKDGPESNVKVAEDGLGHFLVTWNDYTTGEGRSLATRVLRDGSVAAGWPTDGALVTTRVGAEFLSDICADGRGGAFVVTESSYIRQSAIAQHFTATGALAPGWPAEGQALVPASRDEDDPIVVPSDPGSAIAVWTDARGVGDIYAQRLGLDGVVATALSLVSADAAADGVRVVGHTAGPAGVLVTLERQRAGEARLAIVSLAPSANGRVEFVDREVRPGERLGYRLARGSLEGIEYSSELWVDVPLGASFALAGFRPNPSPPRPTVQFSVATSEPARLEVFDTAGRRQHALEIASPAPGPHTLALPIALDPGLYWLRLTQGGRTTNRTAVVVR